MKVPTIKEVYATLDQMCEDGKMDEATREFYKDPDNCEVMDAETMRMLDEMEAEGHLRDDLEDKEFERRKTTKN